MSQTVKDKLAAGALILDVRTRDEFAQGAYPGAINIPVQELGGRLDELPRDRPIVVYCLSGGRSGHALMAMRQAGFADVTNAGGLSDMPR